MNELSLFSGAGGGLLGTMLLGFRPIGYVEIDDYCQRVLAARIRDGILPDAPIFGDIKAFIDSGCAGLYRGLTDVITAGFPCQPFSVAGKRKGADDERNMWPATATVIGIVKPRFVLLENVPGIRKYLPLVVRDLRRLGYEVSRPLILGADDVGAPHRRKRIWILANAQRGGCEPRRESGELSGIYRHWTDDSMPVTESSRMAHSISDGSGSRRAECEVQQGRIASFGSGDAPHSTITFDGDGDAEPMQRQIQQSGIGACPSNVAHSPQRQDDEQERGDLDGTAGGRKGIDSAADFGGQDVADANETGRGEQRRAVAVQAEYPPPQRCCKDMANA